MSKDFFKDLDRIVETATRLSLIEALGSEEEEKLKQKQLEDELADLKSGEKKSKKDEVDEGEEPEAKSDDAQTPTPATPTVEEVTEATIDDIVDKLNMLRSGKSTKDEEVRDQLAAYWDGMQPGEKQSLFAYLTGLTQIMTAGAVGADATDPSSVGIKINARPKNKDQEERSEPAEDLGDEQKEDSKSEEVDAAPIVVGEAISKRLLLKRVKELMR